MPAPWRGRSRGSGTFVTTTWSWSRRGAYGEMGPERAASARAALATSLSVVLPPVRPLYALCDGRGLVLVAGGVGAPGGMAPGGGGTGHARHSRRPGGRLCRRRRPAGGRPAVKSEAKVSPRTPVARVALSGPPSTLEAVRLVQDDLRAAQNIAELVLNPGDAVSVQVELA